MNLRLLLIATAVLWHEHASAYLDPGTGSLIVQGLIAFFVGAIFTIKTFWYTKIKPLWRRLLGKKPETDEPKNPDPQ